MVGNRGGGDGGWGVLWGGGEVMLWGPNVWYLLCNGGQAEDFQLFSMSFFVQITSLSAR